jgi:capsular exopolysaccharide synthesis family protein
VQLRAEIDADHPALVRLDRQIEEVRSRMRADAELIVEAARLDWQAARDRVDELEQDVRALETKALEQSQAEVRVRQLEREAEASRALYENFLERLKETSEQEDLQSADARILSAAEPPLSPQAQSKKRTLALSLMLGGITGVGLVILLDKLNNTFRSAPQLETLAGAPVLGSIPSIGRRVRRRDVLKRFRESPRSSLAEAARSLRTSVLFSNVDTPPNLVMFTSSVPREGKSTTSMLMALTSQQMGKSAIIVDCDLRRPALAGLFDADDGKPGLFTLLEGNASTEEAIFEEPETGLNVLTSKPSEPRTTVNAADILASRRFGALIADLRTSYDLVILDAPPALLVADARILAGLVDAVVYTVRWDRTPRGAVLEGLKDLRSVGAPIAGTTLTLVDESRAEKYAYDGYSYYQKRYRGDYA